MRGEEGLGLEEKGTESGEAAEKRKEGEGEVRGRR